MKSVFILSFSFITNISFSQTFEERPQPFNIVNASSLAFSDVDGDGDQDILIIGESYDFQGGFLFMNDGTGNFTEVPDSPFDGIYYMTGTFSDVDNDGDQDVLITGKDNDFTRVTILYKNDGSGNFTEIPDTPFEGVEQGSTTFSDVDGDGDQDVLIVGFINSYIIIANLYTNDGTGNFTKVPDTPFEGVRDGSIAFSDVDGDGDQDVLMSGVNLQSGRISKLYTNDGTGRFVEDTEIPFEGVEYSSIAFSDVDGDNDQDILITGITNENNRLATLYINDGVGNFTEVPDTPFERVYRSFVAFSDVDGDGDQDVLITGFNGTFNPIAILYTNDGTGNFTEAPDTPFEGVDDGSTAFSDVDGDGDQDVLIEGHSYGSITKLYVNTGMITSSNDLATKKAPDILLYPNPVVNQEIYIEYESEKAKSVHISLIDLNGKILFQQYSNVSYGLNKISVRIPIFMNGIYFIRLNDGFHNDYVKLISQ